MSATLQLTAFSRQSFMAAMDAVKREVGLEWWSVLTDQMALLCRDAMGWTAPFAGRGHQKPTAADREVGANAVKADAMRLFRSMDESTENDWRIVLGGTDQAFNVQDKGGSRNAAGRTIIYGVEMQLFRPDASVQDMEAHHNKYRRRDGKVSKVSETTQWTDIGRWKFLDKMHVRGANLAAYLRYKVAHVGKTKAGWVDALKHFADKTAGRVSGDVPDWIMRHAFQGFGAWGDTFNARDNTGELSAGNDIAWIRQQRITVMLPHLLRTRWRDLQSGKYVMRVQKWMNKHQPRTAA